MKNPMALIGLCLVAFWAATPAHAADNFCSNWAQYMWDFEQSKDGTPDSTWSELSAMKDKLTKGRRLAAVGSVSRADAVPYPSIPSSVETELDPATQQKVRALYERYVLIQRRIEDMWKDKYRGTESATSMQRFAVERDSLVEEMNKISRTAKTEFVRYGLRVRDCFPEYETMAQHQVQALNQSLASASSALKINEGIWANAYEDGATPAAIPVEPQVAPRAPASVHGEPAVVPDTADPTH